MLAMGHLGTRENTFWQLFHQGTAGSRWTLLTPPGVASNGGLVADRDGPAPELVGFEPSQWLKYSPVARTTDTGRSWIAGSLPSGFEDVPDALATEPDGTGGRIDPHATAGPSSPRRGRSPPGGRWPPCRAWPVRRRRRRAGPTTLTAIAAAATGLLGGDGVRAGPASSGCTGWPGGRGRRRGSRPGGPAATATVIRLETSATGTATLVELRRNGSTSLVAAWQAATGGTWSSSQELRADGRVEATASAATGAVVVTSGGDGHRVTAETTGPSPTTGSGAPGATPPGWRRLPAVPAHTAMVVDAQGTLVALSVASSKFWSVRRRRRVVGAPYIGEGADPIRLVDMIVTGPAGADG